MRILFLGDVVGQTGCNAIKENLQRIVKDQVRRSDFVDLRLMGSESLSHLYRNMYRHILTVSYRKIDP